MLYVIVALGVFALAWRCLYVNTIIMEMQERQDKLQLTNKTLNAEREILLNRLDAERGTEMRKLLFRNHANSKSCIF